MEIDQTEGIFERTERSFDPPTHGIELLKISKKSVFWRKESGDRENTATTLRVERSTDHRGRSVPGPHPYARRDTAQNLRIQLYGLLKG